MEILFGILVPVVAAGSAVAAMSVRVVKQFERGLVFRFGRVQEQVRGPGLTTIMPFADRLQKVNMQVVTLPVPRQDGITRDNVTVSVDAVVYFKVVDPVVAVVNVQDYLFAVGQVAQTSLRSIIGKSELDDLLSNRERLNEGLQLMIDNPAVEWGIQIDRVEIKDVALPETMKRSMSRQAEAERERRARIITADGELQASYKLSQAAAADGRHPDGAAAAAAADGGRGRGREELDAGAAVPGRAVAVPGEVDARTCAAAEDREQGHTGRTRHRSAQPAAGDHRRTASRREARGAAA